MKTKRILCLILALTAIFYTLYLTNIPHVRGNNNTIPSNYSQTLDLNKTYIYNVTKFDSKLNWWDLNWQNQGWVNCNAGGQIRINFTGFFDKHSNDNSPFKSPVPYINISFYENTTSGLKLNRTIVNVSSYEASNNLAIGYNEFDPGFLIPTDDFAWLISQAKAQNQSGFWEANITIIGYYKMIEFRFFKSDNSQNTTIIYDKITGLLVYAKVENSYGPDIIMSLDGYELDFTKIPENYFKGLKVFNSPYIYLVSKFDSKLNWYDLNWQDKGWVNCNAGGQIRINFTGFFDKHSNDNSPFKSPVPYINISFYLNTTTGLKLNRTLTNVSSYEAGNNLAIGYNEFDPGFLIPTDDFAWLISQAKTQNQSGFWECNIKSEESQDTIKFIFLKKDNSQNTTIIYDKITGLLVYAKVENQYGPDIEITLKGYQINLTPPAENNEEDKKEEENNVEGQLSINSYSTIIISFVTFTAILILIWKLKYNYKS